MSRLDDINNLKEKEFHMLLRDRLRVKGIVKPKRIELTQEFELFKAELIAIEEARLAEIVRQDGLKQRFGNLTDFRHAFHTLHPKIPNGKAWFQGLLKDPDHVKAEQMMKDLESKDIEMDGVRVQERAKKQLVKDAMDRLKALDLTSEDPVIKDIVLVLRG